MLFSLSTCTSDFTETLKTEHLQKLRTAVFALFVVSLSRGNNFPTCLIVELQWREMSSDLNDLIRKLSPTERHTAISALTEEQINNDLTVHLILNQCHCQKAI